MMTKTNIFSWILALFCSYSYAQINSYAYKRNLEGISNTWHKIEIPDEVFGKLSDDLSDIRIYGITENKDTIEAPYLLQFENDKVVSNEIIFKTINISRNENGYFITFEIPSKKTINELNLDFGLKNYDWKITLQGSQNLHEWFTIVDDYRILNLQNSITNYNFTKIVFPDSQYRYYRLFLPSKSNPNLITAKISEQVITKGAFRNYNIYKMVIIENKEKHLTEIDIALKIPVSVSQIQVKMKNGFDYYRPITIKYLKDSIKQEKGFRYNYGTLTTGNLNSVEKNVFKFDPHTVQKIKLIIDNKDNQPLTLDTLQVKGAVYSLLARFTRPATYFLVYGTNSAVKPQYDIAKHRDKIPDKLTKLKLGNEQLIEKIPTKIVKPLFENKFWLWVILSTVIILLGGFSLSMMRKK